MSDERMARGVELDQQLGLPRVDPFPFLSHPAGAQQALHRLEGL